MSRLSFRLALAVLLHMTLAISAQAQLEDEPQPESKIVDRPQPAGIKRSGVSQPAESPLTMGDIHPESVSASLEESPLFGEECGACDDCCACPAPCIETFGAFLYLQPSSGNLEYATLVSPLPAPSPHWQNQAITPDLSPAFNVGVRFFLNNPSNDIQTSWTHLNTDETATVTAQPNQFVGPDYEIGPDASNYKIAFGKAHYAFDAINLDVGHTMQSSGSYDIRVFGGLQMARISQELTGTYASLDGSWYRSNRTDSLFTGLGPRLGMKAQCHAGDFDFMGEVAGSAIVGRMESRVDYQSISPNMPGGVPPMNPQYLSSPDQTQVVPSLDTKIGVGYTFETSNKGIFRVDAGYMAAVYVNAVSSYRVSDVDLPGNTQGIGLFLRTADHAYSNFAVHGPFASASWMY